MHAHLIIQGNGLNSRHQAYFIEQTQATHHSLPSAHVLKLYGLECSNDALTSLEAYAHQEQLDLAYFKSPPKFSEFGFIIMDMDSTLIAIECIDEIAAYAGLGEQVSAITEAAMRGEITDFKESLTRRVSLLKGLDASVLEQVYTQRLTLNPGAELLLSQAHQHGLKTVLVSGGFTFFTDKLKQRLNFTATHANTLEIIDGKLTGQVLGDILDAQAKADYLTHYAHAFGCPESASIAIGDGANDLRMMERAGISVAYHAKPKVQALCSQRINHNGLDAILNWMD